MAYVDEKIALLEREARRQEKEAETENTPMEEQQDETRYLTLEEMLEAVREGSVTFPNQEKFEFGFSEVLSEKVPMPLVKDIFTDVEENDDAAIYVDDGYGISQIVTLTDKPITEGSIGKRHAGNEFLCRGDKRKSIGESGLPHITDAYS